LSTLTYTANQLIETIRKKAGWTANDQLGSQDADLIRHLNEAMYTEILPRLMKVKEEYFVITRRVPLTSNENRYRIPKRAAGNKIRDLFYIDDSGGRIRLPHISRENLDAYPDSGTSPEAYFLEGTRIVLVPELTGASGSLEIAYFFRPGQLVKIDEVVRITDVTLVGGSQSNYGVAGPIPASWDSTSLLDIHSPNSGAEIKAFDLDPVVLDIPTDTIGFFNVVIDGSEYGADPVEVGDYICLAGEAAIPSLPRELHPVLAQAAIVRMAEGEADDTYQYHKTELDRMLQAAGYLFDTRVEGQPKKLVSRQGAWLYGGGRRG